MAGTGRSRSAASRLTRPVAVRTKDGKQPGRRPLQGAVLLGAGGRLAPGPAEPSESKEGTLPAPAAGRRATAQTRDGRGLGPRDSTPRF